MFAFLLEGFYPFGRTESKKFAWSLRCVINHPSRVMFLKKTSEWTLQTSLPILKLCTLRRWGFGICMNLYGFTVKQLKFNLEQAS